MNLPAAVAIWAGVLLFAALYGMWLGYGGPRFAVAMIVAAGLFGCELFLAAPRVLDRAQRILGERGGIMAPLAPLFAAIAYAIGVTSNWKAAMIGAAYALLPALLVATSAGRAPGTWEDYIAVLIIWLPVEFRWMYRLFPYAGPHGSGPWPLTHTLTILMALSTGVAAFVLLRRMDGIGYAVDWKRGYSLNIIAHFVIFAAIAIPLGLKMHFLAYDPSASRLRSLPIAILGILFFTAWPEEFLFRGLLQNLLSRTFKNQWAGLGVAAIIFGVSHILHAPFPNWKYVLLATIAGLFYGHVWIKTGSLFPAAIVHALVDICWHVLFR